MKPLLFGVLFLLNYSRNPTIVGALLCSTTLLEGKGKDALIEHYGKWSEERAALDN